MRHVGIFMVIFLALGFFSSGFLPNELSVEAEGMIISGKRATSFFSVMSSLKRAGAVYTGKRVEVDGNIITSNGPGSAQEFGETILEKLAAR